MRKPSISRLRHRVGHAIRRDALWTPGMHVVVAVSGGLDSVVMLDLLMEIRRWHGGELSVATVDHGVRAGSSDDAAFVGTLAERYGLPFRRFDLSLPADSSEDDLRRARHAALRSIGADRVATAHHRDDQVETVILRLIRGSSGAGLAGIRPRSGGVVHPMLGTWRREIAAWAAWRGLAWREDPTNADATAERNRVRALAVPVLEAIRPGAKRAIARTADRLRATWPEGRGLAAGPPGVNVALRGVDPGGAGGEEG